MRAYILASPAALCLAEQAEPRVHFVALVALLTQLVHFLHALWHFEVVDVVAQVRIRHWLYLLPLLFDQPAHQQPLEISQAVLRQVPGILAGYVLACLFDSLCFGCVAWIRVVLVDEQAESDLACLGWCQHHIFHEGSRFAVCYFAVELLYLLENLDLLLWLKLTHEKLDQAQKVLVLFDWVLPFGFCYDGAQPQNKAAVHNHEVLERSGFLHDWIQPLSFWLLRFINCFLGCLIAVVAVVGVKVVDWLWSKWFELHEISPPHLREG